jgi:pimeloyl-ACP methyl ester carboxylesterase
MGTDVESRQQLATASYIATDATTRDHLMKLLRILIGSLLAIVALVVVAVAISWAPDRPVESLSARWASPPSRFVDVDGMRVHVRDEGPADDREPIVLLHGTSASLHTWEGWAAALKSKHRVIRLDLPGFGLTGPMPDHDYSMKRYVGFIGRFLDAMGVRHCVLVGNSFGGGLAWETAIAMPLRVARLGLVDAAGYPVQATSVPIAFQVARVPTLAPLMRKVLPRQVVESSVRNVYGDPGKVTTELVDRYYELSLRAGNRQAVFERFRQLRWGEDAASIRGIRQPTLILWGGKDRLIPVAQGQRFANEIAASRLVVFDDLGHVPHEEDPLRTVAELEAFLSGR